jgi:hypothetical protein
MPPGGKNQIKGKRERVKCEIEGRKRNEKMIWIANW